MYKYEIWCAWQELVETVAKLEEGLADKHKAQLGKERKSNLLPTYLPTFRYLPTYLPVPTGYLPTYPWFFLRLAYILS